MAITQRKSRSVSLGLTATLAASLLSGCGSSDPEYDAVCAEPHNLVRIDDDYCDDDNDGYHGGRWYYIPSGRRYPAMGGALGGGAFGRPTNASAIREGGQSASGGSVKGSSSSRGGFGGKSGRSGG